MIFFFRPAIQTPQQHIKVEFGSYSHFFSVLRDFICEDPEGRITTMKVGQTEIITNQVLGTYYYQIYCNFC